ncbi:MAG TPA: DUF4258 domain-containing protein [Pyrinomonadaceae bacterium]|jgi:hypothetical protein
MSTIQRIRQKIQRGEFFFTTHALEELSDEGFSAQDAVDAIMRGSINRTLSYDLRGTRYCIVGQTDDQRFLEVVCRFQADSNLVIITCYDVT